MEVKSNVTLDMLCNWVDWSRDNGIYIGYPSKSVFSMSKGGRSQGYLTEDEALTIDSIVSELKTWDKETHTALVEYLYSGCNIRHVARTLNCHHSKASVLVNSGISWVDGILYMSLYSFR